MSPEDRGKFIAWLKTEIDSNRGLIEQMEKMGLHEQMVKSKKIQTAACKVVLSILEGTETQTISRPS